MMRAISFFLVCVFAAASPAQVTVSPADNGLMSNGVTSGWLAQDSGGDYEVSDFKMSFDIVGETGGVYFAQLWVYDKWIGWMRAQGDLPMAVGSDRVSTSFPDTFINYNQSTPYVTYFKCEVIQSVNGKNVVVATCSGTVTIP